MVTKNKQKELLNLDHQIDFLPFNYKKWIIEDIKTKDKNNIICHSKDYMTTEYEIIPFYKPILILNESK